MVPQKSHLHTATHTHTHTHAKEYLPNFPTQKIPEGKHQLPPAPPSAKKNNPLIFPITLNAEYPSPRLGHTIMWQVKIRFWAKVYI